MESCRTETCRHLEKNISRISEYIRVLNYAGLLYLERKISVLELIISRPKITFGLGKFLAKIQNSMFSKFYFAFPLGSQRGSYCFKWKKRLAECSDIQRSKGVFWRLWGSSPSRESLDLFFFPQEKMNAKNIGGGRVTQFSNYLLVNSVTVIQIRQREREREEK